MAQQQYVVVHLHVFPKEIQVVAHVVVQSANHSGQMYHMCWFMLLEHGSS